VQALGQLQAHREAIKAQIYELTGISDIVRGASKASETLGAQELKSKYASVRIQKLQDEVTRFAQEILQIKAEILVKHFDPMVLAKMANVEGMVPEDQQLAVPALQLLKGNPDEMEWRIHIQADALAMIDYTAQKNERSEFMNSVATFLQSASTVGQGAPQLVPLMLELLKFGVAGFRVSKDVEGIFDRYIKEFNAEIEAKKNAPPPPDPEQEKAKAELAMKQQEAQMKMQSEQTKLQMEQQKTQLEIQAEREKAQLELQQQQQEFDLKMNQMQQEFALKMQQMEQEAALKLGIAQQEQMVAEAEAQQKMQADQERMAMEREHETAAREEDRAFQKQLHDEKIAATKATRTATMSNGKKVSVSHD